MHNKTNYLITKYNYNRSAANAQQKQKRQPQKQQPQTFTQKPIPVSISQRFQQAKPRMTTSKNGTSIIVRHTEYVADIIATNAAFAVAKFALNPGLATAFPWLSNVANNYESYRFHDLHYCYKPICPTSTPGKVMIAIDYDANDATPGSKVIINSYQGTVSTSVWDTITHKSTKENLQKFTTQRYVRAGNAPTGTDLKTYDLGSVLIATSNTPASSTTCGEIFVTYTVELFTPQLNAPMAALNNYTSQTQAPFTFQAGKISVSASGAATLVADYYNQLSYFIVQQLGLVGSQTTLIDIVINPNIQKLLRFDLSALLPAGNFQANIGIPTGITTALSQLSICDALEFNPGYNLSPYELSSKNEYFNKNWYSYSYNPVFAGATNPSNTNLPVYRLRLPWGTTAYLNTSETTGAPALYRNPLSEISGLTPLKRAAVDINWAVPTSIISSPAFREMNVLSARE